MTEQWYTLGNFTFPSSWGALIASFLLTLLCFYFWNRKTSDWYSNSIIIFLFIWKLSVIVVDFQTVINHPITILYFNGGRIGFWVGLLAVIGYLIIKKVDETSMIIMAWMTTILFFELAFHLLETDFLVGIIQFSINGAVLLFYIKKVTEPNGDTWSGQLLLVFTLLQLFFRSFNGGFEYTTVILTYLFVMICITFLLYVRRKHSE